MRKQDRLKWVTTNHLHRRYRSKRLGRKRRGTSGYRMGMKMADKVHTIDESLPTWKASSVSRGPTRNGSAMIPMGPSSTGYAGGRSGRRQGRASCGYVLFYRTERRKIRLTHLCVGEGSRGEGVGRLLVEALREATRNSIGIGLRCRRDFPSWSAWPKLGFVAVDEGPVGVGRLRTHLLLDATPSPKPSG